VTGEQHSPKSTWPTLVAADPLQLQIIGQRLTSVFEPGSVCGPFEFEDLLQRLHEWERRLPKP